MEKKKKNKKPDPVDSDLHLIVLKQRHNIVVKMLSLTGHLLSKPCMFRTSVRGLKLMPDFSKYKKIPQPPGHIVGTVNEPYKIPLVSFYEGGYHWAYERILTVALIPLATFPFIGGVEYPMLDSIFTVGLLFHAHAGFQACIIDYIPLRVYGVWHRIARRLLAFGTSVSMYGIYILETENGGLWDLLSSIWSA